jgi:uridine monophosphate synthetase
MAGGADAEAMAVGLHARGILGYAESPETFITLKSGRRSPHYANFRGLMSVDRDSVLPPAEQMRVRSLTVDTCAAALDSLEVDFDHFAPIPQAVTQLGGAIALRAGVSSLGVRVKEAEKGYGKHQPVEGDFREGDRVVGFDDVITTGQAKQEFLEPMSIAKLAVRHFLVILDREEGGRDNLEAEGYGVTAVIGMTAVNEILKEAGRITADQYAWTRDYLQQYGGAS